MFLDFYIQIKQRELVNLQTCMVCAVLSEERDDIIAVTYFFLFPSHINSCKLFQCKLWDALCECFLILLLNCDYNIAFFHSHSFVS